MTATTDKISNPAGWHEDPNDASQLRYWDGEQWTDHYAPKPPTAGTRDDRKTNNSLAGLGWVTAFLLPFVGFIIGLVLANKGDSRGSNIAWTSVLVFIVVGLLIVFVGGAAVDDYAECIERAETIREMNRC